MDSNFTFGYPFYCTNSLLSKKIWSKTIGGIKSIDIKKEMEANKKQIIGVILLAAVFITTLIIILYMKRYISVIEADPCKTCEMLYNQTCIRFLGIG